MKKASIILICGGSCSGKSAYAHLFKNSYILEMDHFYIGKSKMKKLKGGSYNFDDPKSVDIKACANAAQDLTMGKRVTIPKYDMKISERVGMQSIKMPTNTRFLVIEGIFSFYSPLQELADLKMYIDVPTELRVARRMIRDKIKGRSDIQTLSWSITVEKNHEKYIEPMKKFADIIIPFNYNPVQITK